MHPLKKKLGILWINIVSIITSFFPGHALAYRIRGKLYGFVLQDCGRNFQVASGVIIIGQERLSVGQDVYIGPYTAILCSERVVIEDEVMLAHKVMITDGNHTMKDKSYRFGPRTTAPVVIKHGSWIATNAVILPGVTIGKGSLVGANSVVTKDVPDYAIVGGVPAKVIKIKEPEKENITA
jgi:maltose O-acetyltransferase